MIQQLYNACALPLSAVAGPLFLLAPRGRARLAERYGQWGIAPGASGFFWFHGASAGEIRGLLPLISRMEGLTPGTAPLITATSITGIDAAQNGTRLCRMMPFDAPLWINRALGSSTPAAFIQTETELWPGALSVIRRRGIPIFFVNARISDYTAHLYRAFRPLFAPLLSAVRGVYAADSISADRLRSLGVPGNRIAVTGNTKYDRPATASSEEAQRAIRERLRLSDAPVTVLGSLRPGEDEVWFPAIRDASAQGTRGTVIIVPRHAEKFDYFAGALRAAGIPFERVSTGCIGASAGELRVILFDEFGALESLYSIAALAFIGATLVNIGGHNPLEACAYGVPVCVGPHDSVVRDVTADLAAAQALFRVETAAEAAALLRRLEADQIEFVRAGQSGRQVWLRHQGATARVFDGIQAALNRREEQR